MTEQDPVPAELIDLAVRLVEASGPVIRRYFRTPVAVDTKSDRTPVTVADREAEQVIRDLLARERPDDGILGEEHGSARLDAEFVWVIDPIDGTKSFAIGRPIFGTLVALLRRGRPVLGVIDQPIIGDRWVGAHGRATLFNGATARTRPCPNLRDAVLSATTPDMFGPTEVVAFTRVASRVRYTVYGGDCFAYGLVAAGLADLVVESGLGPWDWAALVPVVEGAGGRITDWSGNPLELGCQGQVVAAGDTACHATALEFLTGGVRSG